MLLVLGIEIVLLVSALYLSNVSTRLNQNAMDLLDMQTSNRADYLKAYCFSTRISPGFLLVSTKKLLSSPLCPKAGSFQDWRQFRRGASSSGRNQFCYDFHTAQ